MQFGVLGPIRVGQDGKDHVLAGELQRTLLAVLLSRANALVSPDVLTEALWGSPDPRAGANLHVAVHRLRRKLPEPERLVSEPGGYRLIVLAGELDAERFETLIQQGTDLLPDHPVRAAKLLRAAQEMCAGEPYTGLDLPLLGGEVQRLQERRLIGLEAQYTAELAAGRHVEIVPELTEAVAAHPLNERLPALLMVALYRSGRQGQALAAYQAARRVLIDELGQEPGPELRDLERRILSGEPASPAGDRIAPQAPAQLPGDVHEFTGRKSQLGALDWLLEEPASPTGLSSFVVIVGSGGVGKTALALHWSHRVRDHFPDGQLYVDLHGFGPDPPIPAEEALGGFLRELGLDQTMIPISEAERAARFRTLVSGRRMLVVIDNAASAEQVRPLLPGDATCVVVVTSRDSLAGLVAREGAHRILLDSLRRPDALELLENLVGARVRDEPDASVDLVERCARLPLAIRIAAELINASQGLRIENLAAELQDQRAALDVLDAGGDESTAVRVVFSWSYRRLASDAARGFRLLGIHPGYDIDLDAAAALLGVDAAIARATLRALLRAHHLAESDGRFHMHDLLRAYAIELGHSVDAADEREAALDRLVDHYVELAEEPPSNAWLDRERTNLVMIGRRAAESGRLSAPTRLAAALRSDFKRHGHHDEALPIFGAALDAATQRGDRHAEGDACRYLGSTYRRLGRLHEAYDIMRRALDSYQQAGSERHVVTQLANLGVTCTWLGRYDEALEALGEARDRSRMLGATGRSAAIGALVYLGQTYLYRGEPAKTVAYAIEALDALAALENPGSQLPADASAMAGLGLERLGRYDEARTQLERSWSLSETTGSPLLVYLSPLALAYWHLGRRDDAAEHAQLCLVITERNNEKTLQAEVRCTLGELCHLNGSPEAALDQHRAALELATSIGLPYQRARAELGIGDAFDDLGDSTAAEQHWRTAHRVWSDIGSFDAEAAWARLAGRVPGR